METPSSIRRVTRSQTLAATSNGNSISTLRKLEDSEKELTETKQRTTMKQQDRSALFDITNDSPIVGLAMGILETPSSAVSKKKVISRGKHRHESSGISTPGSGEALLRGQVKTLLQKVEEEAVLSKLTSEHGGPFLPLKGLVNSPMGLIIAPTPANTPQILSLSAQSKELGSPAESPVEDNFLISQMISEITEGKKEEEDRESEQNLIVTRSLLLDFSEKSEESFSSAVTYQGTETESEGNKEKTMSAEDDDASVWSIQANASIRDEQEKEECDGEDDDGEFYYYHHYDNDEEEEGEEEVGESDMVDELCEGMSKINVAVEEKLTTKTAARFAGKHTRFCYNSDDEIEGEEEVCSEGTESGALCLKGLPTPKGKHLRFPEEDEQMDSN